MELADAVPFGGVAPEIILRRGGARGTHRRQPFAVADDGGVAGIEPRDQDARDVGAAAALGQAEKGPRALAETLDQAGFGQQPQMPGQPRLRLAQDVGEVGDGQFGLRKQRQDAQAGRFAGGFERSGQRGEAQLLISHRAIPGAIRVSAYRMAYKDIFISLSQTGQAPN